MGLGLQLNATSLVYHTRQGSTLSTGTKQEVLPKLSTGGEPSSGMHGDPKHFGFQICEDFQYLMYTVKEFRDKAQSNTKFIGFIQMHHPCRTSGNLMQDLQCAYASTETCHLKLIAQFSFVTLCKLKTFQIWGYQDLYLFDNPTILRG